MKPKASKTTVLQVITSPCGGGAELLVRELSRGINDEFIKSKAVFFNVNAACADSIVLRDNEVNLNVRFKSFKAIFILRKLFKQELKNCDHLIVHAHLTWPLFFVPIAAFGLGVKLIFTEHDTENSRRNYKFFRYLERFIYSRFETLVCITEGVKSSLIKWLGFEFDKQTVVIRNGARFYSLIHRDKISDSISFVSVGSLISKKGFDRTIKALAAFKDYDWQYNIVGEGPLRPDLEKLICSLGLKEKVHLVGWSNDIEQYLLNADIQLIPSRFEGFGLIAIEGQSTGLPVIASNVDGLNEILGDLKNLSALLVNEPDEVNKWVDAIRVCIDHINKNPSKVSFSAFENSQKYSLDSMINSYRSLYLGENND